VPKGAVHFNCSAIVTMTLSRTLFFCADLDASAQPFIGCGQEEIESNAVKT
jgi:hypothetical protein